MSVREKILCYEAVDYQRGYHLRESIQVIGHVTLNTWMGFVHENHSLHDCSMSCRCMCVCLSRWIGVDEDNGRSKRMWSVVYGKKYGSTLPIVAYSNLHLLYSTMNSWVPSRSLDLLVVRHNKVFFRFGSVVWIVVQWMDPSCNITLHPLSVPA